MGRFIVDAILTVFTGGLWLIRVFTRESRRKPTLIINNK